MDAIISNPSISLAQATYMVFVASRKLAEDATVDQAFALSQSMGWIDAHQVGTRPAKASEYAYLLTRSFALKGGVMGSLFPSPRYAYRDLVARGLFSAEGDPDDFLSGPKAVRILGQVMDSVPGGAAL